MRLHLRRNGGHTHSSYGSVNKTEYSHDMVPPEKLSCIYMYFYLWKMHDGFVSCADLES